MSPIHDSLRSLRSSPVFATATVVSLGFALAMNTMTFALIDAVQHPRESIAEPERVYWASLQGGGRSRVPADARVEHIGRGLRAVGEPAIHWPGWGPVEVGPVDDMRSLVATSHEFFAAIGLVPERGRLFTDDPNVLTAVIGAKMWRQVFAGRPLSDSLHLTVRRKVYRIVGVLPHSVTYPLSADVWISRATVELGDTLTPPRFFRSQFLVRLRHGLAEADAQLQLDATARELTQRFSHPESPFGLFLRTVKSEPRELTALHGVFAGISVMVLLIACANVGAMMLARATARSREIALRTALGASRGRLMASVLVECAALAVLGAVAGVLITIWSIESVVSLLATHVPHMGDIAPAASARVFGFVAALAALTVFLAGGLPALFAASADPAAPLKDGAGTTARDLGRHHSGLIVAQVALSTGLLMAAVLMMQSTARLAGFEFRYPAHRLITVGVSLARRGVTMTPTEVQAQFDALTAKAAALPGVAAVTTSYSQGSTVLLSEQGPSGERSVPVGSHVIAGPRYAQTLGLPIIHGRDLGEGDRERGGVLVDEVAARLLWPDFASPVGRMIKLRASDPSGAWFPVIGVTKTIEFFPRSDADLAQEPAVFAMIPGDDARARRIIVRAEGDPLPLFLPIRRLVHAQVPHTGSDMVRWTTSVESRIAFSKFLGTIFGWFSLFAATLTGIGIYGTLAYSVGRRSREFGIRFALGATSRAVSGSVVRHALVLYLAGIGLGAFLALWLTRYITSLSFVTAYSDVMALLAAEFVLGAVALAAAIVPVRRAIRADPVEIMRAV